MLSGEATHTNFIVFGLTRSGLEPTMYHTLDEHTNHYNTDAVAIMQIRHMSALKQITISTSIFNMYIA